MIMLEDFRLKVFLSVAEECSFTRAAASLGVSQPAISQNVAELEKITGRRLFDRNRGEVLLTDDGRLFRTYALRLLSVCDSADEMFAKLQSAVVRISASEEVYTYFISPALETFISIHPEIVIEKTLFGESDVKVTLVPASDPISDAAIGRLRVSGIPAANVGRLSSSDEKVSYYDILFEPTEAFGCTRLCRIIKSLLLHTL